MFTNRSKQSIARPNHQDGKMSAIYEEPGSANEPVKVLVVLHENVDAMDVVGPLEVFTSAQHEKMNPGALLPTTPVIVLRTDSM